jgi:hypothetical protein
VSAAIDVTTVVLGIDGIEGDLLRGGTAPVSARILERLAFIMTTAEEISVMVDHPGAPETDVHEVTDILVAVYANADGMMRRLSH